MKTLAVIPCYNIPPEGKKVLQETISLVDQVIFVDDGSTDLITKPILQQLSSQNPKVTLITFEHNKGKGFALIEAFRYAVKHANFDILVTLDADGQHRPKDIPHVVAGIEKGADLSIGTREFHKMPFRSRISNTFILFLLRLRYPQTPYDTQSGFRAFSRPLVEKIAQKIQGGRYDTELECLLYALEHYKKVYEYPIDTLYFDGNKSSHFRKIQDSYRILKVFFRHRNRMKNERS